MRRRYNMQRSDNFPVCSVEERLCDGVSGRIFVFTGFPVKSAIVSAIKVPQDGELSVDTQFSNVDGFYVIYDSMPVGTSTVKFSYQAS